MIPDTHQGGNIAILNEVSDDQKRRSFSPEFKQEAASLVLDQGHSFTRACTSLGMGESALRRWVQQLAGESKGGIASDATLLTLRGLHTMIRFRLKELIAEKGFQENRRVTLDEVTQYTGVHRTTLSKIANQRGYNTTTDILNKLCEYFGVPLENVAEYIEMIGNDHTL
jgi:putative transcriptional regulator